MTDFVLPLPASLLLAISAQLGQPIEEVGQPCLGGGGEAGTLLGLLLLHSSFVGTLGPSERKLMKTTLNTGNTLLWVIQIYFIKNIAIFGKTSRKSFFKMFFNFK